jgi:hypothetical protein
MFVELECYKHSAPPERRKSDSSDRLPANTQNHLQDPTIADRDPTLLNVLSYEQSSFLRCSFEFR